MRFFVCECYCAESGYLPYRFFTVISRSSLSRPGSVALVLRAKLVKKNYHLKTMVLLLKLTEYDPNLSTGPNLIYLKNAMIWKDC